MREKAVTVVFCILIGAVFLINLVKPDEALSYSERRKLAQAPEINGEFIFSGKAQTELEAYFLDQFAFRDIFRGVKAAADLKVFQKKDNNGIYVIGHQVYKTEYPMKEKSVLNLTQKMNEIYDRYLTGSRVAAAVIPDKSEYVYGEKGYLGYEYNEMAGIFNSELDPEKFGYIDLLDALKPQDYYRTDLHWKQEGLGKSLFQIGDFFGVKLPGASVENNLTAWEEAGYEAHSYTPFYGGYYGQAALPIRPDTLHYFTNETISQMKVENMDSAAKEEDGVIYNPARLGGIDSYEVFLSGNSPLITIDNPQGGEGRELIVFRDSFGSSIAPFLAEGYSRVTLIDLRFVGYDKIGRFVDFQGKDVLFLFSANVANNSDMIRKN